MARSFLSIDFTPTLPNLPNLMCPVSGVHSSRLGEPDEVATVALFLASAAAGYMTGSLVLVDGGYLLS